MSKIKVLFGFNQVAESGCEISPSAAKPQYLSELLRKKFSRYIEFVEPNPISVVDIKRCHDGQYVDDVMNLAIPNGFGTFSQSVVDSLPYTNGAMYDAALMAIKEKVPCAALVSGFHHAGWFGHKNLGYFCTFNGLMIAAEKLMAENGVEKVAIIDCDMHFGNGTEDIINRIDPDRKRYLHITFGKLFTTPNDAKDYLNYFKTVRDEILRFKPDVILYQSGADVHVDDPFGGVLDELEMYDRDILMFKIAQENNIPICWNLAGGYQKDFGYVLELHLNTFIACRQVYDFN